ncbi:hypothetical protein N0V85_003004 [Neurospora sp. IMI 360204]|nr:hypothetical protein N0V85_003004 [Neurospora sp. IMI 360204]
MAVEPRNVSVVLPLGYNDFEPYEDHPKFELWGPRMWTYTPAPAALHTYQEARNHLQRQQIYEQAFSITPTIRLKRFPNTLKFRVWRYGKKSRRGVVDELDTNAEAERARRYVWVNFDMDIINIGVTKYSAFKNFDGAKIQRLQTKIRTRRFEYPEGTYLADTFPNLGELYIECTVGDIENWDEHYEKLDELIGAENVWLYPHWLGPGIFSTVITLAKMREELHEFRRREEEEERERSGGPIPVRDMGQPLIEVGVPDGE